MTATAIGLPGNKPFDGIVSGMIACGVSVGALTELPQRMPRGIVSRSKKTPDEISDRLRPPAIKRANYLARAQKKVGALALTAATTAGQLTSQSQQAHTST